MKPPIIHDATNGKRVQGADYGDYIRFDDGLYQVRGDGHRKQIVKVQTTVVAIGNRNGLTAVLPEMVR